MFTGVRATVLSTILTAGSTAEAVTLGSSNYIQINNEIITGLSVQDADADETLIDAINARSELTGVIATRDVENRLLLFAEDGRNIELGVVGNATRLGLSENVGTTITGGKLSVQSREKMKLEGEALVKLGDLDTFTVGAGPPGLGGGGPPGHQNGGPPGQGGGPPPGLAGRDFPLLVGVTSQSSVLTLDLTYRDGANAALETIDVALQQVSDMRAGLGAIHNRLLSVVKTLEINSANLMSANSRIVDTDFATESTNMFKRKLMTQASAALTSQANQLPEVALSLLE